MAEKLTANTSPVPIYFRLETFKLSKNKRILITFLLFVMINLQLSLQDEKN